MAKAEQVQELFLSVYHRTFPDLRRYVALHVSDPDLIPRLLEEIYSEYYTRLKKGRREKEPSVVLCRLANRLIVRVDPAREETTRTFPDPGEGETPPAPENDPLLRMPPERLWQAIRAFPARTRKLLYLRYGEDMSAEEIAEALKYSLPLVRHRLQGALWELRRKEGTHA